MIEMLARTCKNIINYEISQLINNKHSEKMKKGGSASQLNYGTDIVIELIADMFNLILGKGGETDLFWNTYLINQCKKQFKID